MIPTLLGVITFSFLLIHLAPGDPAELFYSEGDVGRDPVAIENMRKKYGLDKSLFEQYMFYVSNVLHFDLGISIRSHRPVIKEIGVFAPYSILLAFCGMLFATLVGIPSGIFSALRRNKTGDYVVTVLSTLGFAAPIFWLAIMMIYIFSYTLGWTPMFGAGTFKNPLSLIPYLILPTVALGLRHAALIARMTRSTMLNVLNQDYVRTARSKGLRERTVVLKHALRNTLVALVTIIGYDFAQLIGSAMVAELVFARPGLGSALVNSVFARDYPMVQGILIVTGSSIILINLIVDLAYGVINPQLKYD